VLVIAGVVLLVGAALAALVVPRHRAAPAPTTTAPPPPPPPQGLFATQPALEPTSPDSVSLRFRTTEPARATVAYGIDGLPPTLWTREAKPSRTHDLSLEGAVFTRQYRIELAVVGATRNAAKELILPPRALGAAPNATVANGNLILDGHPFFPLLSWAECPPLIQQAQAAGISVFLNDPCGHVAEQVQVLQGHALLAGMTDDSGTGPGQIGYVYPDEADGLGLDAAQLPTPALSHSGRVAFLTLTNHFYSGAAPLPEGRGMYPALVSKADVVGFDLYPLQEWCNPARLVDVAKAQRQLVRLARGKPTFQWIEAGAMSKCNAPADAVTPQTVRAETLLAVAGGAHGIGFFPPEWDAPVIPTVTALTQELDAVGPALLAPPTTATAAAPLVVRATGRNGALYVVAVNPGAAPVTARIAVRGLGNRTLTVLDESRTLAAKDGSFTDTFAPLAARIYVAAPTND
jgi:hypothetical protein